MTTSTQVMDLLDAVRIRAASLVEAKQRYAAELAPDFNLVDHLRNNEVALSRYLGLLLDIKGVHGQGELFLRGLLLRLGQPGFEPQDLLHVVLEQYTHNERFLDIYLEFRGGVIGIENKPWATDRDKQLEDYASFLESKAKGGQWLLVYACNWEPSEASLCLAKREQLEQDGNFSCLDFYQIAEWLDECACQTRAPKVRMFVEELSSYMRREINGELEMNEVAEIKNLIMEKSEYIESAFQVSASMHELKMQLMKELKEGLIKALGAVDKDISLVWDEAALSRGQTYAGFGVRFHPQHSAYLRFQFSSAGLNRLEWGIYRDTRNSANDAIIHSTMAKKFGKGSGEDFWPWYPNDMTEDRYLTKSERNWSSNAEPWLRIQDKTEQGFIFRWVKLAKEVRAVLKDVDAAMR